MKQLSIIIPAYNEEERIVNTLKKFHAHLSKLELNYEILVVDDGSVDSTVEVVSKLKSVIKNLNIIALTENKGKGAAVREGMLNSNGAIRLFSDADGATPIEELEKLLSPITNGETEIAIGSRYLESSNVEKKQPKYRVIWSRMANKYVQKSLLPGIRDPHCGFKAFTSEAAMEIFSQSTVNEWSFDLEVLALAQKQGFKIKEIPVKWIHDERSKGKIRHLPKEILNVYRIKKRIA